MLGSGFEVYRWPASAPVELPIPPRLASWDARIHPTQVRLRQYLQTLDDLIEASSLSEEGLTLALSVGLPEGADVIRCGDLDNYLFPVAQHLGASRFVSAWAEKRVGGSSTVAVGDAEVSERRELSTKGWRHVRVCTTTSAGTSGWKHEIASQLGEAEPAPPGPLEVQLAFRIGPSRNWINLWKPAIDSLEHVLGPGPRRFHPQDGRITRLGLHRTVDPAVGYVIDIGIWWRQDEVAR